MTNPLLYLIANEFESQASATTPANFTEPGYWKRIAAAAETIAGAGTAANASQLGYMRRAAVAVNDFCNYSGQGNFHSSENGYLAWMVAALEFANGENYIGSLLWQLWLAIQDYAGGAVTPQPAAKYNGPVVTAIAPTSINLAQAQAEVAAAISSGIPRVIALRGPLAGSAKGAYASGGVSNFNPTGVAVPAGTVIRSADLADMAELSGNTSEWLNFGTADAMGLDIEDTTDALASLQAVLWTDHAPISITKCYIHGNKQYPAGSPYYGTSGGNIRFWNNLSKSGCVLEDNVFVNITEAFYSSGGGNHTIRYNSFIDGPEHTIKVAGGNTGYFKVHNNLFEGYTPGYDGDGGDPYFNHGDGLFIGTSLATFCYGFELVNNLSISPTEYQHATFARFTVYSDPISNMPGLTITGNKVFGGLLGGITVGSIRGASMVVNYNTMYRLTDLADVADCAIVIGDITGNQLAYDYNNGKIIIDTTDGPVVAIDGGHNTNTATSQGVTKAAAQVLVEAWAAHGNPAARKLQTKATLVTVLPVAASAWNSADKVAAVNLATNDTVATVPSNPGTTCGVRGSKTLTGRCCFEIVQTAASSASVFGIANTSQTLTMTDPGVSANSVTIYPGYGSVYGPSSAVQTPAIGFNPGSTDVWMFLVDVTLGKFWLRHGNVNYGGDPTIGVQSGGYTLPTGTLKAFCNMFSSSETQTLRTASGFTNSLFTGYPALG